MSGSAGAPGTAATVARPMDLVRAFLRSPLQAATWWATIAIILGLGVTLLSAAALSVCFSTGGSLLIWLIGIPIIALGLEVSRLVARVERWRMSLVDPRPLVAHPYQPLNGWPRAPYGRWLRTWAEAEFLDGNRWRDVVYVLVLFPLGILEFVVAMAFWLTAFALLAVPLVDRIIRTVGSPELVARVPESAPGALLLAFLVGLVLVPVASRRLARADDPAPGGRPGPAVRRPDGGAATGRRAPPGQPLRGARARGVGAAADRARPPRRRPAAAGVARDRPRARRGPDRHATPSRRRRSSATPASRRAWRWPSSGTSCAGRCPAILVDRGLEAALAAVAASCPVPTAVISTLAPGERLPPVVERAAYFVVVEALANVAKHSSATRCEVAVRRDRGRW